MDGLTQWYRAAKHVDPTELCAELASDGEGEGEDPKACYIFPAWGKRSQGHPAKAKARPNPPLHYPKPVRLPYSAMHVDPSQKGPRVTRRAAGAWTFLRPFYSHYGYYGSYKPASDSPPSPTHGLPVGDSPRPSVLYSPR
eukprot:Sspe_Gene.86173::Locus_56885_Transcript_1_1_Confidence_1.000_Length_863::g.86173::m.86173